MRCAPRSRRRSGPTAACNLAENCCSRGASADCATRSLAALTLTPSSSSCTRSSHGGPGAPRRGRHELFTGMSAERRKQCAIQSDEVANDCFWPKPAVGLSIAGVLGRKIADCHEGPKPSQRQEPTLRRLSFLGRNGQSWGSPVTVSPRFR